LILPAKENFPFNNLLDETQFQNLFEQICACWRINPDEIIVKFFDDIESKQWSTWTYSERSHGAVGLFNQLYTTDEKRFKIQIAKSALGIPELVINVISHELGHVKLLGGNLVKSDSPEMEPLTDLASIFFGFGIFMANTSLTSNRYSLTKTGYLPREMISYTNALLCYITNKNCNLFTPYLNQNTNELFISDYNYLINTNDTLLVRPTVEEYVSTYENNRIRHASFKARKFEEVIDAAEKLIEINPANYALYNTIGYALLQQKKYQEAIIQFTKAIDIEPFWDYPYNNRGYCKLQLNDFDNAFPDIHSAFEMNPANSFAWRNMGAYYLLTNDFEKALYYFEEAEKMNPKTELINFYLGKVHLLLNNADKAKAYAEKSKDKNEFNDSLIE
jgi:tetratricopeptide (TPR) repeat protein